MGRKIIKRVIFIFSFFMFCYQAKVAINKLQNPNVLDITEKLDITDIQQPLITICPQDQLDSNNMEKFGYETEYQLLIGYYGTQGSLGWGAQHNLTFEELRKQMYKLDLEKISLTQETQQVYKKVYSEIRFYPKFGWCFDISNYTISGEVHFELTMPNDTELEVFLTDKNMRTMSTIHKPSHWGSNIVISSGWTEEYVVKVEQLTSFDPLSPNSCKEYADGEFERCVDEELQKVWKPLINCNPPWLSLQNQCAALQKGANTTFEELVKEPYETALKILNMDNYAAKRRCMKPCTFTRSNILSNGYYEDEYNGAALKITFDDLVIKHTKVINYDFSDYLVDMGSSLGLWFGLSVFGILDLGLLIMQGMKNFSETARKYI